MREQPFYRRFNDAWYVQIGKQQIKLAKGKANRAAAYQRFAELIADGPGALPDPASITVGQLCDFFLEHSSKHHAAPTYDQYAYFLQSFCDRQPDNSGKQIKALKVVAVRPIHVTQWLDVNAWNPTTRFSAASSVKRAFSYAHEQGLVRENTLKNLRKDQPLRRERLVAPEERATIFSAIRDRPFREFLLALQETGARPGEIRKLTREHVNLSVAAWIFPPRKQKTGKKTGRPRVIYLNEAMIELTKELLGRHKDGCLFRNTRGEPWTKDAVVQRMDTLRKRFPQMTGVVAYCYRHAFTTDGLIRGIPIATMAELLGHTSTRMIEQNYSHLSEHAALLREAVRKVTECDQRVGESPAA
jgi:integrase